MKAFLLKLMFFVVSNAFFFQEGFGPLWTFKNWFFCVYLGVKGPIHAAHGVAIYKGEINPDAYIHIAENVTFGPNVRIDFSGGLVIESYVTISDGAHILTHNHVIADATRLWQEQGIIFVPLTIGRGAWIGTSAIVLPQVRTIGDGAIVGAGCVVTKDVEPFSVVGGNPARVIGWRQSPQKGEGGSNANPD